MTPEDVAGLIARLRQIKPPCDLIAQDAAAALAALAQEREDWARRFKLNDVTPWEWMTRAKQAERERDEAREDAERLSWLDRDDVELIVGCDEHGPYVSIVKASNGEAIAQATNIRAAIDAARKGDAK